MERLESLKAKERQAATQFGSDTDRQNSDDRGRTDDIVAEKLGIGSRDTYRKEKYITDNRDSLNPEDFAEWDEGKLSTNKAFNKIQIQKENIQI